MKLRLAVLAMAAAMCLGACSSFSGSGSGTGGSSSGGTGGGTGGSPSTGTGGGTGGSSSSGGAGGACTNVTACGGNAVGTWTVTSSCLSVSGQLDLSNFFGSACASAQATGSLQVSGTWSAKADGSYVGRHDHLWHRDAHVGGRVLEVLGDDHDLRRGIGGPLQGLGYSAVSVHVQRRRWLHVLGHGPTEWRIGVGVRVRVDERQLQHLRQHDHDRRAPRRTRTASRAAS